MLTKKEAINQRHSVRQYEDRPIERELITILSEEIKKINEESGLHIQLVTNEPKAFDSTLAHYGKFSGVSNYIAMVGSKSRDLEERVGYYGEQLVILAQQIGLNTCWVGLTFKKIPSAFEIKSGEKLVIVISIGYGSNKGVEHRSKNIQALSDWTSDSPSWYTEGLGAVLLAPTAVNQQKFKFTREGNTVSAKAGLGFFSKVDLGIVKYHFEVAAGTENFAWGK